MTDKKLKKTAMPTLPTLLDADITTTRLERRSFLALVGISSAATAAALFSSSCGGSDDCDTDSTTDSDPTDQIGQGQNDSCDSDGT